MFQKENKTTQVDDKEGKTQGTTDEPIKQESLK